MHALHDLKTAQCSVSFSFLNFYILIDKAGKSTLHSVSKLNSFGIGEKFDKKIQIQKLIGTGIVCWIVTVVLFCMVCLATKVGILFVYFRRANSKNSFCNQFYGQVHNQVLPPELNTNEVLLASNVCILSQSELLKLLFLKFKQEKRDQILL